MCMLRHGNRSHGYMVRLSVKKSQDGVPQLFCFQQNLSPRISLTLIDKIVTPKSVSFFCLLQKYTWYIIIMSSYKLFIQVRL